MTLIKSHKLTVNKPSLIWNLTDSNGITFMPKIYIGYYGLPIDLIVYDGSRFDQEIYLSSVSYTLGTFKC
jgi:hypothetical protein